MTAAALRELWASGGTAFGGWLVEDTDSAVAGYVGAGFDYVGIDCQHSYLDERAAAAVLRRHAPTGATFLTRASVNSPAQIGRLLDAGSDGIIVPQVDDAEQAAAVVDAFHYPPRGHRSFGPLRADMGMDPLQIASRALCLVMIESRSGLAEAERICAVPGVDGVYVGPADLSIALELPVAGAFGSDQLAEPMARIRAACDANGLVMGAHAVDAASAHRWVEAGCRYISVGSNVGLFSGAARTLAGQLRAAPAGSAAATPANPYA